MTAYNDRLAVAADIPASIGLLTRLPVRLADDQVLRRGGRSAWAWPLVGVIPAGLGALAGFAALTFGAPVLWAAALMLVVQVMITGALHEDGLADTADGLWGGTTRARRLEIMKDSHIGTYGVIALVLSLLLRVAALMVILPADGAFWAIVVAGIVSRAPMVALAATMSKARPGGLSHAVGLVPGRTAWLAVGLSTVCALVLTPYAVLGLLFWCALGGAVVAVSAARKIGGQTGDVLGASQQVAEIAALAVFATQLG
ncbi:adenosylcobinamide-GDP ribazoletransferase [uncultured Aliiroseovarius sp.]|uniref:adenosylcobinamide-GDP ribazoletransferase n=1 Tax=uncultured Aliiroseovarius sp. TaxID=1658783 RepID=UPI00259208CF|nr:adenosylcobinamide-GDP ribazoletransferase [uncultured Aliiroseovarius sp.]